VQRIKLLFGVVLIMMLATSCIKLDVEIAVNDDGSGDVDMLTAIDTESIFTVLAQEFGEEFADSAGEEQTTELCDDMTSDMSSDPAMPADANIEEYIEDGFCGVRVAFDLEASDDHADALGVLFDDGDRETTQLYKEGDNWFFESELDTSELNESTSELPTEAIQELFDNASVVYVVDLPGNAVDGKHNATSVDGGRFTWDIDVNNPPDRLFAQTAPGGGSNLGLLLGLLVGFAVVAGLGWWFFSRRNSREATTMTAPTTTDTTTAGATTPTPVEPVDVVQPAEPVQPVQPVQPLQPPEPKPVFDQALNAWVLDDPVRGRFVHDAATNTWKQA